MFAPASSSTPWVLADIGGTNARFALALDASQTLQHTLSLPVADYARFADALTAYRQHLRAHGITVAIHALGLAIAAPIKAQAAIKLTNSPWLIERDALVAEFALQHLSILNDFAALALSVPGLHASQLRHWPGSPGKKAFCAGDRLAVIGPGTGLGVASLWFQDPAWHAFASEGGHSMLCPESAFECELWLAMRENYPRLSAESLFSGNGLARLHRDVAAQMGRSAEPLHAAQILQNASSDAVCAQSMEVFFGWLGAYLANQVLNLGTPDGLYLAGGILPRCQAALFDSSLYQRFLNHASMADYLRQVPLYLITDTMTALQGMHNHLQQLQRE